MQKSKPNVVVAVDSGSGVSGVVVIVDGAIASASTSSNEEIVATIKKYQGTGFRLRVVIEDIKPYSLKLSPDVIETCKWIGELKYRLKIARIAFKLVSRSEVKAWVYHSYRDVVEPMIRKKIVKKGYVNKDGGERKTSHIWVDDQMIVVCMRLGWKVKYVGKTNKNEYGLNTHSWQALALGTYYIRNVK